MSTLGDLVIKLSADTGEFESDMGRASRVAEREMERMIARGTAAGQLIGDAIGKAIVRMGDLVTSTLKMGEELDKLSQRSGLTVERLSELRFAADLGDVSFGQLQTGLSMFNKTLTEAQNETTKAGQLFLALGVDIQNGPQKAFEQFIKATQSLDPETKAAAFRAAFGRAGDALIPVANNLDEAAQKARALGIVISEDMAKNSARFQDSMKTIEAAARAWIIQLEPAASGLGMIAENMAKARERGDTLKTMWVELNKVIAAGMSILPGMDEKVANYFQRMDVASRLGVAVTGKIQYAEPAGPPDPEDKQARTACALSGGKWVNGACQYGATKAAAKERDPAGEIAAALSKANAIEDEARKLGNQFLIDQYEKEQAELEEINKQEQIRNKTLVQSIDLEIDRERQLALSMNGGKSMTQLLEQQSKKTDEAARQLGLSFASAFEDAVVGGKKLSDVLKGLAADIERIFFRKNVTEPLGEAATKLFGTGGALSISGLGGGGGIGGLFSGLFGGGGGGGGSSSFFTGETSSFGGGGGFGDLIGSFLGSFDVGTDYVPQTGLALVHKGEAIIPAGRPQGGTVFNVDMRGADVAAVDRLERMVARLDATLEPRAIGAVSNARRRGSV